MGKNISIPNVSSFLAFLAGENQERELEITLEPLGSELGAAIHIPLFSKH